MILAALLLQLPALSLATPSLARCPHQGYTPAHFTAVGPEKTSTNIPVPGANLSLKGINAMYLICQGSSPNRELKGLTISTIRSDGRDVPSDPNPSYLSFERFRSPGHRYVRSVPLYGDVLVSRMSCPGCTAQSLSHHFKITLLRSFSIWGSSHHDYREIPFTMSYHESSGQYFAERGGIPFHLAISYPGTWGVDTVVFAKCKSSNAIVCFQNADSELVVTDVVSLASQNQVRLD